MMAPGAQLSPIRDLDAVSFNQLLAQQDPLGHPRSIFDLQRVEFIKPGGLVLLATACESLIAAGRQPMVSLGGRAVRSYLDRVGLINLFAGRVRFQPWFPPGSTFRYDDYRGTNPLLIELTRIQTNAALRPLLAKIIRVLQEEFGYSREVAFDVGIAVSEACHNIFEQNQAACGFLAMQGYDRDRQPRLEIGIADCGVGFAATLGRNPNNPTMASDLDALRLATQWRVSAFDDPTHGTGLSHLLTIVYKHGGSAIVRSGRAQAHYQIDLPDGMYFPVAWMPGVQLTLTLQAKREV